MAVEYKHQSLGNKRYKISQFQYLEMEPGFFQLTRYETT